MFGVETGQQDISEEAVIPVLNAFVEGFNSTIVAYGQVDEA